MLKDTSLGTTWAKAQYRTCIVLSQRGDAPVALSKVPFSLAGSELLQGKLPRQRTYHSRVGMLLSRVQSASGKDACSMRWSHSPHALRATVGQRSSGMRWSVRPVQAVRRARASRIVASSGEASSGSGILVFVEQSQQTLRGLYLKALPGPLCWAPSYLVPAAAGLSVYGAANGHRLFHFLQTLQAPDWFPMAHTLSAFYGQRPQLCNVTFDTLLSTLCTLLIFVGLPAMDLILGMDPKDPAQGYEGSDLAYKSVLHSHVFLHWLVLLTACMTVGESDMHPLTMLGLLSSMGCAGSLIFTVAHELLHSPAKVDKALASLGLMPLAYMHWVPSHIAHHCNVGLHEDPTTARLGEPLYRYIPRSVLGNIRDGVRMEAQRLRARRLPLLSLHNRMLWWASGPLGLLAGIFTLWGPWAAALGIGQALLAIVLLEDVNYIEHYGLRRSRLPTGRYEKIGVYHSWNANWLFTNSIVFSVQRHSDHHAHAYKPYQKLEDVVEAPQLPASYPVMMLLALLPGVFFDVMDPRALRVAQLRGQKLNT